VAKYERKKFRDRREANGGQGQDNDDDKYYLLKRA
jgi:hypothetical protein